MIGKYSSLMDVAKQRYSGHRLTLGWVLDDLGYDTSPLLVSLILKLNFEEWVS